MLLFRRFVSRVLIDTVEQSSRLQREECIFSRLSHVRQNRLAERKHEQAQKHTASRKHFDKHIGSQNAGTGSLISLVAGSQEHMLQLLVGAHGERD